MTVFTGATAQSFTYADTAIGGLHLRNNVRDRTTWTPTTGATEAYATYLLFTEDLAQYTAKMAKANNGKPTVRGYAGLALARFLPFDIDADNRAVALDRTRALLRHLQDVYDVDLGAVRCYFSGNKGFSIEAPDTLFGGFPAGSCRGLALKLKRLALALLDGTGLQVDESIYEPLRLWRIPNSRHGVSKLYKVPLFASEVLTLSIAEIEQLATTPRDLTFPDESEWAPVPALVQAWEGADGFLVTVGSGPLPHQIEPGKRWPSLRTEAARLRNMDYDADEIYAALRTLNAKRCNPPKPDSVLRNLADWAGTLDVHSAWREGGGSTEAVDPLDDDRPSIYAAGPLPEVAAAALRAYIASNRSPHTFVRAGALSRVVIDERGQPGVEAVSRAALRGRLARLARWYVNSTNKRTGETKQVWRDPPYSVVDDILALGAWPEFPPLLGITRSPVLKADGDLHTERGYDPATQLWHAPADGFALPIVPDAPSGEDIAAATATIDDILCDFPFLSDADRAAVWAAIFTAVLRSFIDGPTPLFIFDKPRAGTGASLLAEVVTLLATGASAQMKTLSQDRSGEELRKVITAALLSGSPLITFDNVDSAIASGHLASAITARTWEDRILGRSEMTRLPVNVTWLATGNNVRVRGDIARRAVLCRLDARVERPWERTAFRHPRLLAHIQDHRGELLAAIFTIARAWIRAGRPAGENPALGSFESWSQVIGGILTTAGVSGFLSNLDEFYARADEEYAEWAGFLEVLHEWREHPFLISELTAALDPESGSRALREAAPAAIADKIGKHSLGHAIGQAFRQKQEARYDGCRLTPAGTYKHAVRWQVLRDPTPRTPHDGEGVSAHGESVGSGESFAYGKQNQDVGRVNPKEYGLANDSPDPTDSPTHFGDGDDDDEWEGT